ncbi:MAG: hypothetical protein PPP58_00360, partial [Natronomonas sp.]
MATTITDGCWCATRKVPRHGAVSAGRRVFLSDGGEHPTVSDPIPTGCVPIDELLGGGIERGAATQFYGPPASGKTNLALSAAIEVAVG